VKRILSQYLAQTYPNKELIIFNTDMEHPYIDEIQREDIKIINNDKDYLTGEPYKNRGEICRDAVTHASGDYFMLADDDDIYLPWHLQQAVEGIEESGKDAWKPRRSLFARPVNHIEFCQNTLEASVIVKMDRIREIGFREDKTGYEGLSWYTKLRDEGQLDEWNENFIPSYCFNWSDPHDVAGHKQSGGIDNPNNFEEHKEASGDYFKGNFKPLSVEELVAVYKPYYDFLTLHKNEINEEYYLRYFHPLLNE
jgi:glycosyltransferase involved in cell wall biosynthesis